MELEAMVVVRRKARLEPDARSAPDLIDVAVLPPRGFEGMVGRVTNHLGTPGPLWDPPRCLKNVTLVGIKAPYEPF